MYDKTILRIMEQIYTKGSVHKRELSRALKLGMPSIDYAIKKMQNILIEVKTGNQIRCSIDYSKIEVIPLVCALEYSRISRLPNKIQIGIFEFLAALKQKPIVVAVFGSYAKGDFAKDSDLDILLVYQKVDSKSIENSAKMISMKTNVKINPVYLEYEEFRESFHNPRKKFFKNLRENKILIMGIEWWRLLLDEEA